MKNGVEVQNLADVVIKNKRFLEKTPFILRGYFIDNRGCILVRLGTQKSLPLVQFAPLMNF